MTPAPLARRPQHRRRCCRRQPCCCSTSWQRRLRSACALCWPGALCHCSALPSPRSTLPALTAPFRHSCCPPSPLTRTLARTPLGSHATPHFMQALAPAATLSALAWVAAPTSLFMTLPHTRLCNAPRPCLIGAWSQSSRLDSACVSAGCRQVLEGQGRTARAGRVRAQRALAQPRAPLQRGAEQCRQRKKGRCRGGKAWRPPLGHPLHASCASQATLRWVVTGGRSNRRSPHSPTLKPKPNL